MPKAADCGIRVRLDYSWPVAVAMISANRGHMTPAAAERRKPRESLLPTLKAACGVEGRGLSSLTCREVLDRPVRWLRTGIGGPIASGNDPCLHGQAAAQTGA
jgi:hypothetical protein